MGFVGERVHSDLKFMFNHFTSTYKKVYKSVNEEHVRFVKFWTSRETTCAFISNNRMFSSGVNEFTSMTKDEFIATNAGELSGVPTTR